MKKKAYIYSVIAVICLVCSGCGKRAQEPAFELEQEQEIEEKSQEGPNLPMDAEAFSAMLEEAMKSMEFSPTIQVTCSCAGESQAVVEASQTAVEIQQAPQEPADDGKVNINTADAAALQTLNGIGESRAQAIISYRESCGAFQSIEDIKQVDGIKDGVFNKIRDEISVR